MRIFIVLLLIVNGFFLLPSHLLGDTDTTNTFSIQYSQSSESDDGNTSKIKDLTWRTLNFFVLLLPFLALIFFRFRKMSGLERGIWVLVIFLIPVIGPIAFFVTYKKNNEQRMK